VTYLRHYQDICIYGRTDGRGQIQEIRHNFRSSLETLPNNVYKSHVRHAFRHVTQAVFSTLRISFKILTSVIILPEMKRRIFHDSTHTFALILVGTNVSVLQSESEFA
jgi:hypothetical protein